MELASNVCMCAAKVVSTLKLDVVCTDVVSGPVGDISVDGIRSADDEAVCSVRKDVSGLPGSVTTTRSPMSMSIYLQFAGYGAYLSQQFEMKAVECLKLPDLTRNLN